MEPAADYERVLLVKPTVYLYKIPPITSTSRGFRASDWNLAQPDWSGRLRLISIGDKCFLRLEESPSGQLYCQAPIFSHPGPQVQPVSDSRRYFVVKVVSDTGRSASIGIGFADGADSFDLNVALQDHFAGIENASKTIEESLKTSPKLDLTLKGDIRVNLNIGGNPISRADKPAHKPSDPSKPFILPPPPSSTTRRR